MQLGTSRHIVAHASTSGTDLVPSSMSLPLKSTSSCIVQPRFDGEWDGASVLGRGVGVLDIGDHVGGSVGTELAGDPDSGMRVVAASAGNGSFGVENGVAITVSDAPVVSTGVGTNVGSEVAEARVGSGVVGAEVGSEEVSSGKVGSAVVGISMFVAQQRAENVAWTSGWHDLATGCADEPNEMWWCPAPQLELDQT